MARHPGSAAKGAERTFAHPALAMLIAGTAAAPHAGAAQEYPVRPLRLVVPAAPGGGTDIIARLLAQSLNDRWGQSVVVDNRGGAGGIIAVALVAASAPDGYTMLLGSMGHLGFAPALHRKLPYDPQRDLAPISLVASQPFVLVVHPGLGVQSTAEFLALAKSRPGTLRYASGGSGGASHLGTELLQLVAGVSLVHVPYKGTGPGTSALLAGEAQLGLAGVGTVLPHLRGARLKALAVTGEKRSRLLPEVPTLGESGVPGYAFDVWYGMLFPGRTPQALVARVHAEVDRLTGAPVTAERFAAAGLEPVASAPDEFAALIRREIPKWKDIVARARIEVQ